MKKLILSSLILPMALLSHDSNEGTSLISKKTKELDQISNIANELKNKIISDFKNQTEQVNSTNSGFESETKLSIDNVTPSEKETSNKSAYNQSEHDRRPEFSQHDNDFSLGIEFLYWQALSGSNLEYAFYKDFPVYETTLFGGRTIADGLAGEVATTPFDWEPGVRIRFGYETPLDGFDLSGEYTYYNTQGENSVEASPIANPTQTNQVAIKSVFPTNFTSSAIIPVKASSKARLNYQIGDLMIGKRLAASQNFSVGIKGGIEASWLDHHWKVSISDFSNQNANTTSMWRFWGIGPGIAIDCNWDFIEQFSLFVDVASFLLYGHHSDSLTTKCSSGNINNLYQKISPTGARIAPHAKLSLGFRWEYEWSNYLFNLFTAYEINSWANIAEIYQFHDIGLSGSQVFADALYSLRSYLFSLQGVNIGMDFSF